ncbi:SDR family NAD(P)-dependent oxidoreductase [Spongiactinospora sp. TRM90649]|uniref:SDR family oxidoreductase n=1 Tax=Spongiactinospora sp. TRM90649 TaxID=3031114 RepID=UPI0023F96EFB|nr:SDR family NAD(P)-dependent oxidoreductase [Spongiactinospora sp. TRM90649]MDF5757252.1 SDR family NAD(P)-dependent oxidoreductase [Spongiactinospora sp. TRM90649]
MSAIALITGAASGIGAAVARRLAAGGARCVLVDVDAGNLERVAKETGSAWLAGDVADPETSRLAVALAVDRYGRLDLVHLNAGISGSMGLDDFDPVRYQRLVEINVDGVVYGLTAAVPELRRDGGAIVVTSSLAGLVAYDGDPFYTMTKHAVIGLVRAFAGPLAADGVRIAAVCPGFTDTPLIGAAKETFSGAGFPLLTADAVAAAVESAFYSEDEPGAVLVVQPGRPPVPYRFAGVPGPAGGQRPPDVRR